MTYVKQTWVDNSTGYPVSAARMGHIEDGLETVDAALAYTPTISELTASAISSATLSVTISRGIFIAPFALRIVQASLTSWSVAVAADDTNFWTIAVRAYRSNTGRDIASKTTKVTGGEAIGQRTDWNFDAATFDTTNQLCAKGDCVGMSFTLTGSSAGKTLQDLLMTVRYEPV